MQQAPVVEQHQRTRRQAAAVLKAAIAGAAGELAIGAVEVRHLPARQERRRPVEVVEADLDQIARRVEAEGRPGGLQVDALVVVEILAGDLDLGEDAIELRRLAAHLVGDAEGVDEDVLAADPVEGQAMEHLVAGRVEAVGAVGMRPDLQRGIGGVLVGEIGGEIPVAAEDGLADIADALGDAPRRLRRRRRALYEAEAVELDLLQERLQPGVAGHQSVMGDLRGLGHDPGLVPEHPLRRRPGPGDDRRQPGGGVAAGMAVRLPVDGQFLGIGDDLDLAGREPGGKGEAVDQALAGFRMLAGGAGTMVAQPEQGDRLPSPVRPAQNQIVPLDFRLDQHRPLLRAATCIYKCYCTFV